MVFLKCLYIEMYNLCCSWKSFSLKDQHCVHFCRSKRVAAERNSGILMLVISCIIYAYYTCKYFEKMLNQKQKQLNEKTKKKEKRKLAKRNQRKHQQLTGWVSYSCRFTLKCNGKEYTGINPTRSMKSLTLTLYHSVQLLFYTGWYWL